MTMNIISVIATSMATPFSEPEKQLLRERLLDAGEKIFTRFGLRKARIEDIAKDAGIAKGSFYAFFPSKEELFLALLERLETTMRSGLVEKIMENPPGDRLAAFFEAMLGALDSIPFLKTALNKEELAWLERKLPPGKLKAHVGGDDEFIRLAMEGMARGTALTKKNLKPWVEAVKVIFYSAVTPDGFGMISKEGIRFLAALASESWKELIDGKRR